MEDVNLEKLAKEVGAIRFRAPKSESPISAEDRETLLAIDGVQGIGLASARKLCVYVRDGEVKRNLPKRIGGFEVTIRETGLIHTGSP